MSHIATSTLDETTSHSTRLQNTAAKSLVIAPLLTPQGHLRLTADADAPPLPATLHDRLAAAFAVDTGHGLLQLGASEVGCALPPALAWWRDFAVRYMTALCATPEGGEIAVAVPGPMHLCSMPW